MNLLRQTNRKKATISTTSTSKRKKTQELLENTPSVAGLQAACERTISLRSDYGAAWGSTPGSSCLIFSRSHHRNNLSLSDPRTQLVSFSQSWSRFCFGCHQIGRKVKKKEYKIGTLRKTEATKRPKGEEVDVDVIFSILDPRVCQQIHLQRHLTINFKTLQIVHFICQYCLLRKYKPRLERLGKRRS